MSRIPRLSTLVSTLQPLQPVLCAPCSGLGSRKRKGRPQGSPGRPLLREQRFREDLRGLRRERKESGFSLARPAPMGRVARENQLASSIQLSTLSPRASAPFAQRLGCLSATPIPGLSIPRDSHRLILDLIPPPGENRGCRSLLPLSSIPHLLWAAHPFLAS
jgi:hypothetical protein